jgi:hypothetical protein
MEHYGRKMGPIPGTSTVFRLAECRCATIRLGEGGVREGLRIADSMLFSGSDLVALVSGSRRIHTVGVERGEDSFQRWVEAHSTTIIRSDRGRSHVAPWQTSGSIHDAAWKRSLETMPHSAGTARRGAKMRRRRRESRTRQAHGRMNRSVLCDRRNALPEGTVDRPALHGTS